MEENFAVLQKWSKKTRIETYRDFLYASHGGIVAQKSKKTRIETGISLSFISPFSNSRRG